MTKRDELAAWLAELPDSAIDDLYAQAARLRVTMAPAGESLAEVRQAWERSGAQDALNALAAVEADLAPGEVSAWIDELWANATPYRYDESTGELVEVKG
jgi:hypothetical protein